MAMVATDSEDSYAHPSASFSCLRGSMYSIADEACDDLSVSDGLLAHLGLRTQRQQILCCPHPHKSATQLAASRSWSSAELEFPWEITPDRLTRCKQANGQDWRLG